MLNDDKGIIFYVARYAQRTINFLYGHQPLFDEDDDAAA
jgi:hypothetical protein